jgi:hypothetical protein
MSATPWNSPRSARRTPRACGRNDVGRTKEQRDAEGRPRPYTAEELDALVDFG